MDFEKCREILLKEHEAIAKAANLQKMAENSAIKREWTDFEAHLSELNILSGSISAMERERERLFSENKEELQATDAQNTVQNMQKMPVELAGGDKGRFYTLCLNFSAEQRSELCEIYRSLKREALKLRFENEALLSYLNAFRINMTSFFEAAFPDIGGKMYTQAGIPVSHDMRSMVVNKSM